jgi:TatD DNase family protein
MFIETHAHLYADAFDEDRDAMIQRAQAAGITAIYLPNVDMKSYPKMIALEQKYPNYCHAMSGLHPCSVKETYLSELKFVEKTLHDRKFCAVGEIGIDLYWDKTFFKEQIFAFEQQMDWAQNAQIPIIIHSRNSTAEVLNILRQKKSYTQGGIFHCFGGSVEEAKAIIDLGFHIGIGGVLTYKKSGLDETLKHISLEHIVLETDAPYLAPVPFRGKRNETAYLTHIAQKLAAVKGVSVETVGQITSKNAQHIFSKMGILNEVF